MFVWLYRRMLKAWGSAASVPVIPGGIFRRAFWSWPREFVRSAVSWKRVAIRPAWTWTRVAKWSQDMAIELEPAQLIMTLSESRIFGFDFSDAPEVADGGTIIDAMASGAFLPASVAGLTFGSVTVTSVAFDDIPADGGLKAQITASIVGTYSFSMKGTTTAGRILNIPCELTVVADHG